MVEKRVTTRLPTHLGEFRLLAYEDKRHRVEHLALVKGVVHNASSVLVRIHSQCLTGDVFGSMRCDCGEQLRAAMQAIQKEGVGVLVYLRQEGRGIGLVDKLRAYQLQDHGLDTVEANLELGFGPDDRDYEAAVAILEDLGVRSVRLLTNNPRKLSGFDGSPIGIVERIPIEVHPNDENHDYLRTKRDRLGHFLDLESSPRPVTAPARPGGDPSR
ncbi:MAG: GTP cyclohydrolase II [Fidelibacterota bacterium]